MTSTYDFYSCYQKANQSFANWKAKLCEKLRHCGFSTSILATKPQDPVDVNDIPCRRRTFTGKHEKIKMRNKEKNKGRIGVGHHENMTINDMIYI